MKKIGWVVFISTCLVLISCAGKPKVLLPEAEASRKLAAAYISQKKYTLALRELLKAEEVFGDDPVLQNDLGFVYLQKNSLDLSLKHFKKALKLKPDFSSAKNNLGTVYLKKEEWDAAIACFKELTENLLYTTPQKPLINLGWAYYNKKEYALSEEYYQKALSLYREGFNKDFDYIQALYGLSQTYIATGRYSDAASTLEQAAKDAPREARLFFDLAEVYTLTHDFDRAHGAYQKVIELAPDSDLSQKAKREVKKIESLRK